MRQRGNKPDALNPDSVQRSRGLGLCRVIQRRPQHPFPCQGSDSSLKRNSYSGFFYVTVLAPSDAPTGSALCIETQGRNRLPCASTHASGTLPSRMR